ncbi:MAG TPA: polyphosphate kinase 2 family protein, partial [Pseudomonadota bacterium]|nr:polyphosphate kinase 2 family protein [Pseudomonadota bacterium]
QTREKWKDYKEAYEDALRKTATERAPWHVVPANNKWFRNLVIAETIVETLRPYKKIWRKKLDDMGVRAKSELEAYRQRKSE